MASRSFSTTIRRVGGNTLDLPLAALAALSVGFVFFAMPGDLFADLIGMTGLPSLLPAAQPPLGATARIFAGAVGMALVFGAVFLLLRRLDRGRSGFRGFEAEAETIETPRLRRRDLHPDAPPRPPIFATRDLGEPSEDMSDWMLEAELESEAELILTEPEAADPEPEAAPAAEPPPEDSRSIPELMERLERGLARRRKPATTPEPEMPQVFPDAADARLRSAIENLQRVAGRHS